MPSVSEKIAARRINGDQQDSIRDIMSWDPTQRHHNSGRPILTPSEGGLLQPPRKRKGVSGPWETRQTDPRKIKYADRGVREDRIKSKKKTITKLSVCVPSEDTA